MFDKKDVTILIPVLNEDCTIKEVISYFIKNSYNNILVVDGNSTDNTQKLLDELNVQWFIQSSKGKGNALIEAFSKITTPYTLLIDADNTNSPIHTDAMIQKMINENLDHVIGNRLKTYDNGAFTKLNLIGNKIINTLFRIKTRVNMTDILSGYRLFSLNCIKQMNLTQTNFNIETEISLEIAKKKLPFAVIDTYYRKRMFSKTKLRPFKDGFNIIKFILFY